jgi:hypothetical protein
MSDVVQIPFANTISRPLIDISRGPIVEGQ